MEPKTVDMHQLCRKMQRVARSDTRYNFVQIIILFCRSLHCYDVHTSNTMHVFVEKQYEDELNIVLAHHCRSVVNTIARPEQSRPGVQKKE